MRSLLKQEKLLLWVLILAWAIILFFYSSARHILFHSTAWDLAIFDQAIYLISQGKPPVSSVLGFNLIGEHFPVIIYPLALFYFIYPSVYWLFLLQVLGLISGAVLVKILSDDEGLKPSQSISLAIAYLLYPLVFNINLLDFHPDVFIPTLFFGAVWAARKKKLVGFLVAIILALTCKAVIALPIITMGIWLYWFEERRIYGATAMGLGLSWFLVVTQVIIPSFGGNVDRFTERYGNLGNSMVDIALSPFLNTSVFLSHLFTWENLGYLLLLFAPVLVYLSWRCLTPLLAASPILIINLLAEYQPQKDLVHQYSLPILPFLFIAAIASLGKGYGLLKRPRWIILWSAIAFIALAKYGWLWSRYLNHIDTWSATRNAIARIDTQGGVLTSHQLAPHLSHRPLINTLSSVPNPDSLQPYDWILVNTRNPGMFATPEMMTEVVQILQDVPEFTVDYKQDDVYLFARMSDSNDF